MSNVNLDELVSRSSPVTDEEIASLDLKGVDQTLLADLLATPVARFSPETKVQRSLKQRRLSVSLAAAVVLLIAGIMFTQIGEDARVAWAAEAVEVAKGAPRLLSRATGSSVVAAEEFSTQRGSITFSNGDWLLHVQWAPVAEYSYLIQDRSSSSSDMGEVLVAGLKGRIFRSATDHYRALWVLGDHVVEASGEFASRSSFTKVLATLEVAEVDEWLSALPDTVVKPDGRARAVDRILLDIPLPHGFDISAFHQDGIVQDHYQLGATLTTAVTCNWVGIWLEAADSGDDETREQAATALIGSRGWEVLHQMRPHGGFPEVIWEFADAIESGEPMAGGTPLTIHESYSSLCDA